VESGEASIKAGSSSRGGVMDKVKMEGVREYAESYVPELIQCEGRYRVRAINEGGHNCTEIDLADLLTWLWRHRPQLVFDAIPPENREVHIDPSDGKWPKFVEGKTYTLNAKGDYSRMIAGEEPAHDAGDKHV
jgi:hypothetical protein